MVVLLINFGNLEQFETQNIHRVSVGKYSVNHPEDPEELTIQYLCSTPTGNSITVNPGGGFR